MYGSFPSLQKYDVYETGFIVYSAEKAFPLYFSVVSHGFIIFINFLNQPYRVQEIGVRTFRTGWKFFINPYSSGEQPLGMRAKTRGKKCLQATL